MKINIFSYQNAEKKIIESTSYRKNWISIRDIGFESYYKKLDDLCENVLVVKFDDVTEFEVKHKIYHPFYHKISEKRPFVLFNSEMARQIIKFVNNIKDNEINIHCWAGKSRSQAIGSCLNQYYNLFMENNEEDFIRNLQHSVDNFMANSDVIKIMNKELFCL